MGKVKNKIAVVFTILFAAMLSLFGCGDPYRNMKLTVDADYNVETDQYYKDIVMDDDTTSFSLSATVSGMSKGVSSDVEFVVTSIDSPAPISSTPETINKTGNTTTASFKINNGGQSVVEVITKEGPNGGLREKVYINIIREVKGIDFKENEDEGMLYIERGSYLDLVQHITYTPADTSQKDIILQSVEDIVGGNQSDVVIEDNKLYISETSEITNFTLVVASASNKELVASVPVVVVDLMNEEDIMLTTYDETLEEYVELDKNDKGEYTITLANNSQDLNLFNKKIYFSYQDANNLVSDEYKLFVEDENTSYWSYSACSVEVLNADTTERYATIQQISTGVSRVTFGFTYRYASGLAPKYVEVVVNVVIFPTSISATSNGEELDENNPYLVYDSSVYAKGDPIQVVVYGVGDNTLIDNGGLFYISVKKDDGETDNKVSVYNKYDNLVGSDNAVNAQSGPFYVRQSYNSVDEITGQYYVEIVSAVDGASQIKKTFPIKFVNSNMDISCETNVALKVNGSYSLVINGLGDLTENLETITITGYDKDIIDVTWNMDSVGNGAAEVLIKAKDVQGITTIRFIAPNGINECRCTVTVYDELVSAEVSIMGHTFVAKDEDDIIEEDIETIDVAGNQDIQMYYNINGMGLSEEITDALDCSVLSQNTNVVGLIGNNRLVVKNTSSKVLITIIINGYDDQGSKTRELQVKFYINVVVLVTDTRYTQSHTAYSYDNLSDQSITKKIEATYSTSPATALISIDNVKWNVQVGTYNGVLNYNYDKGNGDYSLQDDLANSGATSIATDETRWVKTYTYYISGNSVVFELSLSNCKMITTYATLSSSNTISYSATAEISQTYTNKYGDTETAINNGTHFKFTINSMTLVDSITITNLPIENDQYMLTFDNREVDFENQRNNEKVVYVNVGPTDAINKNLQYKFNIDNANQYFDVRIENVGLIDYEKAIYIKIKASINDGNLPSIRLTISSTDGGLNATATFGIRLLDGSYTNPYLVSTPEDLDNIRQGLSSHYLLTSDIDLTYYIAKYYRTTGWEPIGSLSSPFTGSLRGDYTIGGQTYYHTIKGLTISQIWMDSNTPGQGYAGLFGAIKSGNHENNGNVIPTISNINISGINISITAANLDYSVTMYIGGLVGKVLANGYGSVLVLQNISVNDGAISSDNLSAVQKYGFSYSSSSNYITDTHIGGVAGYMEQSLNMNITSTVSMDLGDNDAEANANVLYVGAIAGTLDLATIENNTTSEISINQYDAILVAKAFSNTNYLRNSNTAIGGIVGYNKSGNIRYVTTRAYISGYNNIGGAVGINAGTVDNVTSTIYGLYGNNYIGGLIGRDALDYDSSEANVRDNIVEITGNFQVGSDTTHIYGNSYLGGLIGSTNGMSNISNNGVYAYNKDNGKNILSKSSQSNVYLGGLIGADYYPIGTMTSNANIEKNFTNITITHSSSIVDNVYIGGLVGYVYQVEGNITYDSNATLGDISISADVDDVYEVSDFVGYVNSQVAGSLLLSNSYSTIGEGADVLSVGSTVSYDNIYDFANSADLLTDYTTFMSKISVYNVDETNDTNGDGFNDDDLDLASTYGQSDWYAYTNIMKFTKGDVTIDLPIQIKNSRKNGDNYIVNLVINVVPAEVIVEVNQVWSGNVLTVTKHVGDTDVTSYALQYFQIDSSMYSSGVIKGASDSLSREIEDYVLSLNTYSISGLMSIHALPRFIDNTKITIVSSNPNIVSINYNSSGDAEIQTHGIGTVTLTAYSIYDETVHSTPVEITVVGGQVAGSFEVSADSSLYVDDRIEIVKNINEQLNLDISNTLDYQYTDGGVSKTISIKMTQFNDLGVMYNVDANGMNGNEISINGTALTSDTSVMVDKTSTTATIRGTLAQDDNGVMTIVATPYLKIDDNTYIYLDSEQDRSSIQVKVINGTRGIYIADNSSKITIEPWTQKQFDVVIDTDNRKEILYFNVQNGTLDFQNSMDYQTYYIKLDSNKYALYNEFNEQIDSVTSGYTIYYFDGGVFDESNGRLVYTFRVGLDRDNIISTVTDSIGSTYDILAQIQGAYATLEKNDLNNIRFYTQNRDGEIEYNTDMSITLLTQELSDSGINMTYYPYAQTIVENNQEVYYPNESSSDTIVVGKVGLLNYSVRPIYANVDHFEITSTNNMVTFAQLYRDDSNGYRYVRTLNDETGTYGQIVSRVSNFISAKDFNGYNYSGNLYLYTLLGDVSNVSSVTITLYGVDKNDNIVGTYSMVMKVVEPPRLSLTYKDRTTGVIARGTTTTFTGIAYAFDSEIQFTNSYIIDKATNQKKTDVLGHSITIEKVANNTYSLYCDLNISEGSTIYVEGYVSKIIEGKLIEAQATLEMKVVKYVVDSISVENVTNGNFVGLFGQNYPVKINVGATYNDRLYGNLDLSGSDIYNLSNSLSDYSDTTKFQYYIGNDTYIDISENNNNLYKGFSASLVESGDGYTYLSIRNKVLSTSDRIYVTCAVYYDENGIPTKAENLDNVDYTFVFTLDFGFACYRSSENEHPEPIFSEEGFREAMLTGTTDYILMNDITLTNWKPVETNISSLDGNGYVITVDSFDLSNMIETEANIGIFSTIPSGTIIKNMIIEVLPKTNNPNDEIAVSVDDITQGVTINKNFDFVVDASNYTTVNFGVLAGTNNGTVTNVTVTYNAKELKEMRDDIIGTSVKYGSYDAISKRNSSYIRVIANTSDIQAYMGTLVGVNGGYITNSAVENISIFGVGYVGGLVGQNNQNIASSYFSGGNIQNQSTSATSTRVGTGGLVAINNSGATIDYSYVVGRFEYPYFNFVEDEAGIRTYYTTFAEDRKEYDPDGDNLGKTMDITGLASDYKATFVGANYSILSDRSLISYRAMNSAISSNTPSGGFVYSNSGTITNSYSNILVNGSSSGAAGFVYSNERSGMISETYSLSSVRVNDVTNSPFTGQTADNTYNNDGTIKDSHYLKLDGEPIRDSQNEEGVESYTDEFYDRTVVGSGNETEYVYHEYADAITATQFGNYTTFAGYAFNEDFEQNELITTSVWFIPTYGEDDTDTQSGYNTKLQNTYQTYFKKTSYIAGRPELVSANLKTVSIRVFDEEQNALDPTKNYYQYASEVVGESITNPYLIYDAKTFDEMLSNINSSVQGGSDYVTYYTRMINDISYLERTQVDGSTQESYVDCNTYKIDYAGVLDGNNMTVSNLRLIADRDSESTNNNAIEKLGLFASIKSVYDNDNNLVSRAVVKNLNIDVTSVDGTGVQYVGTLAGIVEDSNVYNVNVTSSVGAILQANHIVGGAIGLVRGDSEIVNVTSSVSATAYYKSSINEYNHNQTDANLTTYYSYVSEDTEDGYVDNVDKVSYVGGVIGVANVTSRQISTQSARIFSARIRKLSATGSTVLTGENVGGVVGYIGKDTTISNSSYIISDGSSATFIASRAAGGITAENHGTVDRCYVEHSTSTQETIDNYFATNRNATFAFSTSNYTDLFGRSTLTNKTTQNAHYIGGLVGINIGGVVENSYSKVAVYNHDALVAGGLVGYVLGGEISSSYTTGTVASNKFVGGLVGLAVNVNRLFNTTGQIGTYANDVYMYISNIADFVSNDTNNNNINGYTSVYIQGGVAENIWRQSDYLRNGTIAFYSMGSFAGAVYDYGTAGEDVITSAIEVPSRVNRLMNESNYTVTMVNLGSNRNNLNEVGNMTSTAQTGGIKYESDMTGGKISYHLYKDFMTYSSGRTYEEFISRQLLYSNSNSWNGKKWQLVQGSGSMQETDETIDLGVFKDNGEENKIFQAFSSMYWNGTSPTLAGENGDGYITPAIKQETFKNIVNVYTEDDLLQIYEFLDSEFILCNDIVLTSRWNPVGTEEEPFTGILRSFSSDTIYTISNIEIMSQESNVGFFGVISGAELKDFNLEFNSIEAIATDERNNVGSLVAYISADGNRSTISNVNINFAIGDVEGRAVSANLKATNALSFGGAIGVAQNVYIDNLGVNNAYMHVDYTDQDLILNFDEVNKGGYLALGVGGVIGVANNDRTATVSSANNSAQIKKSIHYGSMGSSNGSIVVSLNDLGQTSSYSMGVGGLIGEMNEATVIYYADDVYGGLYNNNKTQYAVKNNSITVNSTGTNNLSNLYVGGAIGNYSVSNSFESREDFTTDIDIDMSTGEDKTEITVDMTGINATTNIGGVYGYTNKSGMIDETTTLDNIDDVASLYSGEYNNIDINVISQNSTNSETQGTVYVGGFAGQLIGNAKMIDMENINIDISKGYLSSNVYVGGFAGYTNGYGLDQINVSSNISTQITTGADRPIIVGGLVGYNNGTLVSTSTTQGTINSSEIRTNYNNGVSYYGGLIGKLYNATANTYLYNSATSVEITSNGVSNAIGGAVGYNENANVERVVASGKITQANATIGDIGGFVGTWVSGNASNIISNTDIITSTLNGNIAGFIGNINGGNIDHSYTTGYIDMSNATYNDFDNLAGFVSGSIASGQKVKITQCYSATRFVGDPNKYILEDYGAIVSDSLMAKSSSIGLANTYYVQELLPNIVDNNGKSIDEIMSSNTLFDDMYQTSANTLPTLAWLQEEPDIKVFDRTQATYIIANRDISPLDNISGVIIIAKGYDVSLNDTSKYTFVIGAGKYTADTNYARVFDFDSLDVNVNNGVLDYCMTSSPISIATNNGTIYRIKVDLTSYNDAVFCETNNGTISEVDVNNQNVKTDQKYINSIFRNYMNSGNNFIATSVKSGDSYVSMAPRQIDNFDIVNVMEYTEDNNFEPRFSYDVSDVFYTTLNTDGTYKAPELRWTLKDSVFDAYLPDEYYWSGDSAMVNRDFTYDGVAFHVLTPEGFMFVYRRGRDNIYIENDLDFSGKLIKNYDTVFEAIIDGQGHTIKNISKVDDYETTYFGFINVFGKRGMRNVVFEDGFIYSSHSSEVGIVGYLNSAQLQNVANDNVTIISSSGAAAGLVGVAQNAYIQNAYVVADRKRGDGQYVSNIFVDGTTYDALSIVVMNYQTKIDQVYSRFMNSMSIGMSTTGNNITNLYGLTSADGLTTRVSIVDLQNADLGFDWTYAWSRDNSANQLNDRCPILQFQYSYWIEQGATAELGVDFRVSGSSIFIDTEKGLAWLSYITSSEDVFNAQASQYGLSNITLQGYNIYLTKKEFNMAGALWSPIGMNDKGFAGIIEGNTATIYNLNMSGRYMIDSNPPGTGSSTTGLNDNIAFIDKLVSPGVITDVQFAEAQIYGRNNIAVVVAKSIGGTVNHINVTNSVVNSTGSVVAAMVSYVDNTAQSILQGCYISDTTINSSATNVQYIGLVVGQASEITDGDAPLEVGPAVINGVEIKVSGSAQYIGGVLGGGQISEIYRASITDVTITATSADYVGLIAGQVIGNSVNTEIHQNYITSSTLQVGSDKIAGGLVGSISNAVVGENILVKPTISSAPVVLGTVGDNVEVYNFYSTGTSSLAPYGSGSPAIQSMIIGPSFGSDEDAEKYLGTVNYDDLAAMYYNPWWSVETQIRVMNSVVGGQVQQKQVLFEPTSLDSGNANITVSDTTATIQSESDWQSVKNRVELRYLENPTMNVTVTKDVTLTGIEDNMIGTSVYQFNGTFTSNGNTVTLNIQDTDGLGETYYLNLMISPSWKTTNTTRTYNQYYGLFGNVGALTISNTNFVVNNDLTIAYSTAGGAIGLDGKKIEYDYVGALVAHGTKNTKFQNCDISVNGVIENDSGVNMSIGSIIGSISYSPLDNSINPFSSTTYSVTGVINNKVDRTGLYIGSISAIANSYYGGGYLTSFSKLGDIGITSDIYNDLSDTAVSGYGRIVADSYFKTNSISIAGSVTPNHSSEILFDFDTNKFVAYLKVGESVTINSSDSQIGNPGSSSSWYTYTSKVTGSSISITSTNNNIRVYQVNNSQVTIVKYNSYNATIPSSYQAEVQNVTIWPGCLISDVLSNYNGKPISVDIKTAQYRYESSAFQLAGVDGYPYVEKSSTNPYTSETHSYQAGSYQLGRSGTFEYNGTTYTGIPYYMDGTNSSATARSTEKTDPANASSSGLVYYVYTTTISFAQTITVQFVGLNSSGDAVSKNISAVNVTNENISPSIINSSFTNTNFQYWQFDDGNRIYKSTDSDVGSLGALINIAYYDCEITKPTIVAVYTGRYIVKATFRTVSNGEVSGGRTYYINMSSSQLPGSGFKPTYFTSYVDLASMEEIYDSFSGLNGSWTFNHWNWIRGNRSQTVTYLRGLNSDCHYYEISAIYS